MGFGDRGRGGGFRAGGGDRSRGSFRGGRGEGFRGGRGEGFRGGRNEGFRGGRGEGFRAGRGEGFRGGRSEGFRGGRSEGFRGGRGDGFRGNRGGGAPRRGFGGRGGGAGGFRGGSKVFIEPHRHDGVFIARGKDDALVTKNLVIGESVYKEKRISVQEKNSEEKTEYRMWNPFRSKLAAAILGGVQNIWMKPGSKVLYLGAASGTTVSHVSDVVGSDGIVYAVEFSHRSGRDLLSVAKKRPNVVPIIEDARYPQRYAMMLSMVDVIFSDIAQPDQSRILALNAQYFLKNGGHYLISIKANCVDSTAEPTAVFADEVRKLTADKLRPLEQITLEPYERDHAVVVGVYRS